MEAYLLVKGVSNGTIRQHTKRRICYFVIQQNVKSSHVSTFTSDFITFCSQLLLPVFIKESFSVFLSLTLAFLTCAFSCLTAMTE